MGKSVPSAEKNAERVEPLEQLECGAK